MFEVTVKDHIASAHRLEGYDGQHSHALTPTFAREVVARMLLDAEGQSR